MEINDERFHRRRRKLLGLGCGCLVSGAIGIRLKADEQVLRLCKVRQQTRALGTQVTITALHRSKKVAAQAISEAFSELNEIEDVMSLYRPHSQVCKLNLNGVLEEPDVRLVEVLGFAKRVSRLSDGVFDVTVQPLWELFARKQKQGKAPSVREIGAARSKVDWKNVKADPRRVTLPKGAAITLNGIAQGYAADRVRQTLARWGIDHALIDCGELSALGNGSKAEPWKVGIQHPREADAFAALVRLSGRCLATSGDYESVFDVGDGKKFQWHHIFDPKSGVSPEELASVSVVAPTAMQADALSTAVFVAGVEAGTNLLSRFEQTDALMVLKNGRTLATKGFPWKA